MFGLNVFVEPDPTGNIDATREDSYNIPFRKSDAKYRVSQPTTKSYNRMEGDIPPQFDKHHVIHHHSVTMHLNNLQNFNPTSKGLTYFEEHDTNKHIHHGGMHSHPANRNIHDFRDTKIVDEIDDLRKGNINFFEKPKLHSHSLKTVRV